MKFPKSKPIRLKGPALAMLRIDCFLRDGGRCVECGTMLYLDGGGFKQAHMAHIKSRGANGADVLSNVRTLCLSCHMAEHNGGKPVPKREVA